MADKPVLLTDEQMQQFIRDGYLILHPDFPEGFHEKVYKRIDESFEKNSGRNPGNNLLPAVPELQDVWDHPIVHGAFSSILGPDYYLHLHRHVHESRPGSGCAHHAQRQLAQQPILRRQNAVITTAAG